MTVQAVQLLDFLLSPFDTLEVPHCPDPQLAGCIFVRYEQRVGVELNARDSVHVVDTLLDALCERMCLVLSDDNDKNLSCVHDGLHTYGQGHSWHLERVVVEEPRVVQNSIVCKGLDTSSAGKGRAGLVESDVTIRADTSHEEVDSTNGLDLGFVLVAFRNQVWRVAVEDVDILRLDVDVGEEVVPHERVVAFRVRFGKGNVFVHVEGDHVLE